MGVLSYLISLLRGKMIPNNKSPRLKGMAPLSINGHMKKVLTKK